MAPRVRYNRASAVSEWAALIVPVVWVMELFEYAVITK